ncbi:prolyl oligopeptidase family serine peptidase [Thermophagus xiamenensis]|uniref:Putative esterase n=1 Tax=Thermophagus xiamenensis TaxID=385682 RepID=A0A1I1XJ33_9BACT|nr:prolyl oligopeptidase family serine peptidase [Thermophagus xiamenensis]SFE07367.1 Putative esterase [Thermophagus xiamenensis]
MSTIRIVIAVIVGGFLFKTSAIPQYFQVGPQVETFYSEIDDSEQPFALYLPENFDPEKPYPLVVMLHGAMSNHRLALRRVFGKTNLPGESDAEASRYFPQWEDVDYIVAAPYARGTMGYVGIPEEDVMAVIEKCRKDFNIDEDRIYLTGLSMGGGGTLYIGLSRPDVFAAIAPVCPALPFEVFDLMENGLNLPIAIFQGGADPVVRPEGTRQIVDELRSLGTLVEYYEYPGVHHDSWANAYANGNIFKWFDGVRRNPFPDRVRFATKWYKYSGAYWVTIDKLTPGTLARIDAEFTDMNQVNVETDNLEAFSLNLKGHPRFNSRQLLSVTIDGQELISSPGFNHAFRKEAGKWISERFIAGVKEKKKGLEGPLSQVVTSRHVYVYGTLNAQGPEEIEIRKKMAEKAADFSVSFGPFYHQRSTVNPRVIADRQVTHFDKYHSNMILFGTKETNSVLAEMADELPLHLENLNDSLGLVYCYPNNGHLVVVSSGLPFWISNKDDQSSGKEIRFGGSHGALALKGMKDFLLFRNSNDNVIVEGYFEHDWTLPQNVLEKFTSNGVNVNENNE